jgi:hypothetical protein
MRTLIVITALALLAGAAAPASATGLATCQSGSPSTWKSQDALKDRRRARAGRCAASRSTAAATRFTP